MILKHGEGKALAAAFAAFFAGSDVRRILNRYGFSLPDKAATR